MTASGLLFSQDSLAFLVCILPFKGQLSVFGSLGSSVKALDGVGMTEVLSLPGSPPRKLLKTEAETEVDRQKKNVANTTSIKILCILDKPSNISISLFIFFHSTFDSLSFLLR